MPRPFQRKAKNLFLTFPNIHTVFVAPFDNESACAELEVHLSTLETAGLKPTSVSVAVEAYPGEPERFHCHCLLSWDSSLTHNLNLFKFRDIGCHSEPVSRGVDSLKRLVKYLEKDGCFITGHTFEDSAKKLDWTGALSCTTKAEARTWIQTNAPRNYVLSHGQINQFLDRHYAGSNTEFIPNPEWSFSLPDSLQEWLDTEFPKVTCHL